MVAAAAAAGGVAVALAEAEAGAVAVAVGVAVVVVVVAVHAPAAAFPYRPRALGRPREKTTQGGFEPPDYVLVKHVQSRRTNSSQRRRLIQVATGPLAQVVVLHRPIVQLWKGRFLLVVVARAVAVAVEEKVIRRRSRRSKFIGSMKDTRCFNSSTSRTSRAINFSRRSGSRRVRVLVLEVALLVMVPGSHRFVCFLLCTVALPQRST